MQTYKAYKFRLYPTYKQRELFNKTIGCGRLVYNWALAMRKEAYEKEGITLSIRKDISPKVPKLKEEKQFLKETDSKGLLCQLNNLDLAYKKFFKDGYGFPKFKHKESVGSYTTQLTKGAIHQDDGYVILRKCGAVKCVFHRKIDGIVKDTQYVTISRTAIGEFYISILASCEIPDVPTTIASERNTIGIDMGLKDLAILDDGTKFERIAFDEKIEKRKKRLQRRLAKKVGVKKGQKKSNNFLKLQRKISKLDAKVARRREHYQYNVVAQIAAKDCEYIGIENLNVKGMSASGRAKKKLTAEEYAALSKCDKKKYNRKKNRGFNKSILNAGFYSFKTKLEHKAQQNGKEVITIGRFYASSQTCSVCGAKNKKVKNLKVREWTCQECGSVHDRDINAAKNIRNETIRIINEKCETTHKNLTRCNREVKSAENHRNEKSTIDRVVSRLGEPEIQVIHYSKATESEVIAENIGSNATRISGSYNYLVLEGGRLQGSNATRISGSYNAGRMVSTKTIGSNATRMKSDYNHPEFHLGLNDCAEFCKQNLSASTKQIILIHLSHTNVNEAHAIQTVKEHCNFDNVAVAHKGDKFIIENDEF